MEPSYVPEGYITPLFYWDEENTSNRLKISEDGLSVKVINGAGFKTSFGSEGFSERERYYFEVKIIKGTLIKIGVSREVTKPHVWNQAFTDLPEGWEIYNGETRHNSNALGSKYGERINPGDVIGIMLDMVEGKLSFSWNGVWWGVAYESEELTEGKFFPAVAPIYLNDEYRIWLPQPED